MLVNRLWMEQKLAYPIDKHQKGTYWLTYFEIEGAEMPKIDRALAVVRAGASSHDDQTGAAFDRADFGQRSGRVGPCLVAADDAAKRRTARMHDVDEEVAVEA